MTMQQIDEGKAAGVSITIRNRDTFHRTGRVFNDVISGAVAFKPGEVKTLTVSEGLARDLRSRRDSTWEIATPTTPRTRRKRNNIPDSVSTKLEEFEEEVAHWTARVDQAKEAINTARERLSGGFERDEEYNDMRALLDRLVEKDLPNAEGKLDLAEYTLSQCRAFIADLPDDVSLEEVAPVRANGHDLASVRSRISDAEDELQRLQAVPVPGTDIEKRVGAYVAALARPKIIGTAAGQRLQVSWPNDVPAMLALVLPEKMVGALMGEVERQANTPLPLAERKQRIGELQAQIDTLQRAAFTLGDTGGLPPQVILGVRVVRNENKVRRVSE